MQGLINQPHGIQCARVNGSFRMMRRIAKPVHAFRELAAGRQVGKDHVAVQGEQRVIKAVTVARLP